MAITPRAQPAPTSEIVSVCQSVVKTPGISDVAPNRLHISRHYGKPFHRAARTGDGRLVPVGLLARGSGVSLQPSRLRLRAVSGMFEEDSPLTVAGAATGSAHFGSCKPLRLTVFPKCPMHCCMWHYRHGH